MLWFGYYCGVRIAFLFSFIIFRFQVLRIGRRFY